MAKYILSDPNFSAGRDNKIVEQIVAQVRDRQGVKLIGYEPDPDFDRLPIELLGRPEAMMEAILAAAARSEEHTSELQSLMRISYAVFCLKKKKEKYKKKI